MTVSAQYYKESYKGDGITRVFPFRFQSFPEVQPEKNIQVTLIDRYGREKLLSPNSYKIVFYENLMGGEAHYPAVELAPALANNETLVITRRTPLTQEEDFKNQGKFFPEMIENGLDKLTFISQEFWKKLWELWKIVEELSLGGGDGTSEHPKLLNRWMPDQHPIEAITGLEDALSNLDVLKALIPYRPTPISPQNNETQVELYVLLKITPYGHPLGLPMGGVHWQLAKDAGFTDMIFESRRVTSADSMLITSDPAALDLYLKTNTTYFWRARYFDLRETDSDWSSVRSFTTESVATENLIVQPDILHPVNGGAIPERGFFSSVSHPVAIGNAVPDALDYQIAITPDFAPSDILVDKQDHDNLTHLYLDTAEAEFRYAPSPLYARVRQKDNVRDIKSRWSPVPTMWIQRVFRDAVVGREVRVDFNTNRQTIFWIDRKGNHVAPQAGYWNDSPIWSSLVKIDYNAPTGQTWKCCRVPAFFTRAESIANTGVATHRYWVSIAEFENSYLHPAFVHSPSGFLLTNLLTGTNIGGVQYINTLNADGYSNITGAYNEPQDWYRRIKNSIMGSNERIVPYNIHAKCAIQLLALIELGVPNLNLVPMIYRGIGNINCGVNKNYAMLSHNFKGSVDNNIVIFGIPSAYNMENTIYFHAGIQQVAAEFQYANAIFTGFSNDLGAHLELYNIPHYFFSDPNMWNKYHSRVNTDQGTYDLSHRGGELAVEVTSNTIQNDYTFGVNARLGPTSNNVFARALVLD